MSGDDGPEPDQGVDTTRSVPGEPQAEVRPAVRQGRQHRVQPHAAGQHPVDPRLGVVEPAPRDPGEAHGKRPQVVDLHPHGRPLDASPAVDPDDPVAVDEQVGDRPVGGQLRPAAPGRPAARACPAPPAARPSSPRVAVCSATSASIEAADGPDPARMARRTEASSGPARALTTRTATRVDRGDHGIRTPADAVTAGAGEQPALGVARHVRVVGEVVQVGDAEVGDDLVDDVGAGPTTPGDEAQVGWHVGRLRAVEEARHRGIRIGQGPGAQPHEQDDQGAADAARPGAPGWPGAGRAPPGPGRRPGRRRRRGPRPRARPAAHRPGRRARRTPPRRAARGSSASGGTRPRTWRRSSHRRPGRCSTPAVTSRPPRRRSRSTTTDGGPVAASRRPTARASVLAPRPPEAPTTAVTRWVGWSSGQARRAPRPRGRRRRTAEYLWTTAPRSDRTCGRRVPSGTPGRSTGDGRDGPVGGGDPRRSRPADESGHGTAPVGGTTGAVGEPSSGGEKPVRRSLNPEGERVSPSCPMTDVPAQALGLDLPRSPSGTPVHDGIRRLGPPGLIFDDPLIGRRRTRSALGSRPSGRPPDRDPTRRDPHEAAPPSR